MYAMDFMGQFGMVIVYVFDCPMRFAPNMLKAS